MKTNMKKNEMPINRILFLTSIGLLIYASSIFGAKTSPPIEIRKEMDFKAEEALFWGEENELIEAIPQEKIIEEENYGELWGHNT